LPSLSYAARRHRVLEAAVRNSQAPDVLLQQRAVAQVDESRLDLFCGDRDVLPHKRVVPKDCRGVERLDRRRRHDLLRAGRVSSQSDNRQRQGGKQLAHGYSLEGLAAPPWFAVPIRPY
jgi:hypothetical protein